MRRVSVLLMLAAALYAPGACFAQVQAQAGATGSPDPMSLHDPAVDAAADARADDARTGETRSAFGRVMAVMISALQHQASTPSTPSAPVRTTAAGTPMDIQIGAAFSDAMREPGARAATDRVGAAATGTSGARTTPADPGLRQAVLAGPN